MPKFGKVEFGKVETITETELRDRGLRLTGWAYGDVNGYLYQNSTCLYVLKPISDNNYLIVHSREHERK